MVLHFEKWSTWVHRWTVLHWLILLLKDFPRQFIYLTWLYTEFERQSRLSKKMYANIRNIFSTDDLRKTFWFIFKFMMLILTHTHIYIINPFAKRAQLGKPVPMQPRQPATQAGWREPGPGCKGYIYIYIQSFPNITGEFSKFHTLAKTENHCPKEILCYQTLNLKKLEC